MIPEKELQAYEARAKKYWNADASALIAEVHRLNAENITRTKECEALAVIIAEDKGLDGFALQEEVKRLLEFARQQAERGEAT
jgi:hypothetical protein